MRKSIAMAVVGAVAALGLTLPASGATAAPRAPIKYKNCAALKKVYKYGVGKPGAIDRVRPGQRPTNRFARNRLVYLRNIRLDTDRDGIACEPIVSIFVGGGGGGGGGGSW